MEVHGREYCFGGHDGTESGVFTMRPRVGIPGITLRQSIVIGKTRMTELEVHRLAVLLGRSNYRGVDYNLLSRYPSLFYPLKLTQFPQLVVIVITFPTRFAGRLVALEYRDGLIDLLISAR